MSLSVSALEIVSLWNDKVKVMDANTIFKDVNGFQFRANVSTVHGTVQLVRKAQYVGVRHSEFQNSVSF